VVDVIRTGGCADPRAVNWIPTHHIALGGVVECWSMGGEEGAVVCHC